MWITISCSWIWRSGIQGPRIIDRKKNVGSSGWWIPDEANMINFRDACTFDNSYIEGLISKWTMVTLNDTNWPHTTFSGSNVSSEWVVLNTKYQKRVEYDEMGIPFYEMVFIYRKIPSDCIPQRTICGPGRTLDDQTIPENQKSLQRMPSFYILTMIVPIWLMFSLSIFTFYIPTDGCEKITLSISILIGQTVFLTLIAKRVPETSIDIPLLGLGSHWKPLSG